MSPMTEALSKLVVQHLSKIVGPLPIRFVANESGSGSIFKAACGYEDEQGNYTPPTYSYEAPFVVETERGPIHGNIILPADVFRFASEPEAVDYITTAIQTAGAKLRSALAYPLAEETP